MDFKSKKACMYELHRCETCIACDMLVLGVIIASGKHYAITLKKTQCSTLFEIVKCIKTNNVGEKICDNMEKCAMPLYM